MGKVSRAQERRKAAGLPVRSPAEKHEAMDRLVAGVEIPSDADPAGDKAGNWRNWYRTGIPFAERRYREHMTNLGLREYE
ncbi:hypothetical protein [Streptomyces sp. NPDC049881]|uniref:hypothetical protein n=1 Tax=Streptomyces sp. NPDC049881 TaxID=3155778 RepID=UPI0034420DB4